MAADPSDAGARPVIHSSWILAASVLPMLGRVLASPRKAGKRARQLLYRWRHRPEHLQYLRLLREARARGIAGNGPLVRMKYLGVYLAEPFSIEQRRAALTAHYGFLQHRLPDAGAAVWRDATLWEQAHDGGIVHRIRLEPSLLSPMEGESQLRFEAGGVTLSTLTFSLIDGAIVGLADRHVLFVGGVQGGANCREEMRAAAKANGEINATAMLILAARALAEVLGVEPIVGVSSDQHAAVDYAGHKITLAYDRLWQELGGTQTERGFFLLDVQAADDGERESSGKHRARARKKRQLKADLHAAMRERTAAVLGLPLPSEAPQSYARAA